MVPRASTGSAAAGAAVVRTTTIDDAIRALPAAWFKPNARIYWTDMLASAAIGWSAFVIAVVGTPRVRAVALIVAAFALYRAVLFIHELTHLAAHELPAFRAAWNAIVGLPLLLPSFVYEGVHTDHHRQRTYGTAADPEYVPFGRRPPLVLAAYSLGALLLPLMLVLRFGVIAPLSWILPPLRRVTIDRWSALVVNHRYVRHARMDRAAHVEEALATALVWTAILLWRAGVLPGVTFVCWYVVTTTASAINVIRTLASHRYDHDVPDRHSVHGSGSLTMIEQLLDSCTIRRTGGVRGTLEAAWRELWAPVGLRYHALHHWIPSLPYHNLGHAHRLLLSTLGVESAYGATEYPSIAWAVVDLVQRARRNA